MKLEKDVVVDLLPAYFSGEASTATRLLVEDYFRDNPDFEKFARNAASPLEMLRVPTSELDSTKEKLAFERARTLTETRSSFLMLAIITTLMLFLFRIQNGRIVWIFWSKASLSMLFVAMATFFWAVYLYVRVRKAPLPSYLKFLWMAIFYTVVTFLFQIKDHKLVWLFFTGDSSAGIIFLFFAIGCWAAYFIQRWKAKRTGNY
jgi:hypothetical protein